MLEVLTPSVENVVVTTTVFTTTIKFFFCLTVCMIYCNVCMVPFPLRWRVCFILLGSEFG